VSTSTRARISLRTLALAYLLLVVLIPISMIAYRTFEPGFGAFWASITTPAAISALQLTVLILAIVVPLNAVFGVALALALVRGHFPGKRWVHAVIDLPFALSPVVVGVSLVLLWGAHGWFGGLDSMGIHVIYALPGMVLATIFVTLPFVTREVEPVLREIGSEQEQAAATLGASAGQTFRKITLPAIRWGLTYGVVLTVARALGEFGAVSVVSLGFAGQTQTLTLLVNTRYSADHNISGAYAAATLLMLVALAVLALLTVVDRKRRTL
jgi:sulfate/thiosulfate transport system permease protein